VLIYSDQMLKRDLQSNSDKLAVSGYLIVNMSTNLDLPIPGSRIPPSELKNSSKKPEFSPFEDEKGRLPFGWEWGVTPEGRRYYVDHNTRTTSFVRPKGDFPRSEEPLPEDSDPLPPLWEKRATPEGRPYYIDHNTKTTTWVRPKRIEDTPPEYRPLFDPDFSPDLSKEPFPPDGKIRTNAVAMDDFSAHDSLRSTLEVVERRIDAGNPSSSTNPSKKATQKDPPSGARIYPDLFRLKEQARR
jgi:hypothetical protein